MKSKKLLFKRFFSTAAVYDLLNLTYKTQEKYKNLFILQYRIDSILG